MKKAPYMASAEMQQLMWLSAMVQMVERITENTKEKDWLEKLKNIETLTNELIGERLLLLDEKEKKKVERRATHLAIKVYGYDDVRVDKSDYNRSVTVSFEDLVTIADAALLECKSCPQGDVVKDCQFRKALHSLGLNCGTARENPAKGECEFRNDNKQTFVTPQYKRMEDEVFEQLP